MRSRSPQAPGLGMVEVRRGAHAARTSRPWCVSLGTRHELPRSRELLLQLRLLPPAQSARGHVVVGLLADGSEDGPKGALDDERRRWRLRAAPPVARRARALGEARHGGALPGLPAPARLAHRAAAAPLLGGRRERHPRCVRRGTRTPRLSLSIVRAGEAGRDAGTRPPPRRPSHLPRTPATANRPLLPARPLAARGVAPAAPRGPAPPRRRPRRNRHPPALIRTVYCTFRLQHTHN